MKNNELTTEHKKNMLCLIWIGAALLGLLVLTGCGNSCLGCDVSCFDMEGIDVKYANCTFCGQTMGSAIVDTDGMTTCACDSNVEDDRGAYCGAGNYSEQDNQMTGIYCGQRGRSGNECFAGCVNGLPCVIESDGVFAYVVPMVDAMSEVNDYIEMASCLGLMEE